MEITGTITDGTKSALSGYRVVAYHGDVILKKEKPLGGATTDKEGKYSILVDLARYPLGVNVRLAVLDGAAKEVWSSPIRYNVKGDLPPIDATIPDASLGITEYERLTRKTSAVLEKLLPGATLVELQPAQIVYLAGRSDVEEARLNLLITAARLHKQLSGVPEEAFYGLFRQGLPANIAALVALTEDDWQASLDAAARGNVISPVSRAKERAISAALIARKATEALRPSLPLANGTASFAAVALKSNGKVQKVAAIAARYNGVNGAFWRAVEHDRSITDGEREKLQNHAAISEIIGGDPELLRRVAAHLTQRGEKVTPAALATIKRTALSRVAETTLRANGNRRSAKERKAFAESTATALTARVAATFPTEALRAELSAAPAKQYLGRYRNELQKFFDNTGFDLRTGLYAALNPSNGSRPFRGISNKEEVKKRLETMTRLFRTLPEQVDVATPAPLDDSAPASAFAVISTLAEKEYYSSSRIAGTPRARFVADVSTQDEDKPYWGLVYDRATAMRDVAWLKGAELVQMFRQPFPVMRRFRETPAEAEAEAGVAEWRTLFGSLDMCDCEACASITSPAAYLADILNFLGTDVAGAEGKTPFQVLTEQRPDIPHILLNCDNANREVPYIDLVNELLEDEVIRKSGAERVWAPYRAVAIDVQPSLLDGSVKGDAETVLANKHSLAVALNAALPGYDFDTDMDVAVVARGPDGGVRWHLLERGWLVELSVGLNIELSTGAEVGTPRIGKSPIRRATSKKPEVVHVDNVSRQTYGTKAELAANPAFRNTRATERLEEANFPLSLPPGLPLIETRLFLNHLQVPRERLIKHLAPDADGWATEYLGLSATEASLITSAPGDAQYVTPEAKWGFRETTVAEADSLIDPARSTRLLSGMLWTDADALRRVDVLIARANISYLELLDLLDTYFVNPPYPSGLRRITIQSTDTRDPATCDLRRLKITGKLGWLRDPENRTHALRTDIGDPDDFFDRLGRFLRLKRRSGWTARELDLAIRQVHPGKLDAPTLRMLAALKWTKDALRLGHAEACALFGVIDTMHHIDHAVDGQPTLPSQYEQLFQNRATTNPVDRNFALDDKGIKLRNPTLTLAEGKATLAAAFQISESDVTLLAEKALQIAEADATRRAERADDSKLSLQVLSDVYRRVLFARGFRLEIQEMTWLEELAGTLPASDRIPAFVEQVNWIMRSKLSMTDAWFLLRGNDALTAHLVPREKEIGQTLGDLRDQLQKIESEHGAQDPNDPDGTLLLRKRLGALDWGEPVIDDLLATIADTRLFSAELASLPARVTGLLRRPGGPVSAPLNSPNLVPTGVEDLVAYDSDSKLLRAVRTLTRSDRKRLLGASVRRSFRKAVEQLFALGKLSHAGKTLTCRGVLPADGVEALIELDPSRRYEEALRELADQQQQLLTQKLRYCTLPEYQIDLAAATHLELPPALAAYVYCDAARRTLVIRGQLTKAEQETLLAGATPPLQVPRPAPRVGADTLKLAELSALLVSAPPVNKAELVDLLAKASDVKDLFDPKIADDMPATTAEITTRLLKDLTPYARDVSGRKALVRSLSTTLGLATDTTNVLVGQLPSATPPAPGELPARMINAFRAVTASDSRAAVDPVQYAGLFDDCRRLSKIALLFQRLEVEAIQLPWVFDHGPFDYASKGKWLDVGNLTSGAALGRAGLRELSELVRLFTVTDSDPYNVTFVDGLLRLANSNGSRFDDVIKFIGANTPWTERDLIEVCKPLSLSKPADFISAKALDDLYEALQATHQLGATVAQAIRLTKPARLTGPALDDDDARLAKSLAKSKHDPERWLEIVKPINDNLREARRSAMVDYLVANPRRAVGSGWLLWHDVNSLYDYLLVDVQMGACMTTSRIRLALGSVQLFVQRCLMNLEAPRVNVSDDPVVRRHWDEWESWRKLYRVWEANRRIFLYPENWIEPELRDDKTAFFKELENELLQNEVTQETAEAAFLNYLHKLDQVGKLEVMGMFIEDETGALADGASSVAEPEAHKRILHVVARTYGDPHQWFYRKLVTTREWHEGLWSPWEKIDADVTGDHILPVIWNHHLYLFWALFEQRADKPTAEERMLKDNPREPKNRWYIKLAWSEHRNGKWSPKRVSKHALRTPVVEGDNRKVEEADFSFKTNVTETGIGIKCYGPKSDEPTATAESSEKEEEKEGYPLARSYFSANSAFYFYDEHNRPPNPELTLYVYRDGQMLFEARSNDDGQGSIWLWDRRPNDSDWRGSTVELRTKEMLRHINPPKLGTTLHPIHSFETWAVHAQVVKSLPPAEENKGPSSVRSPGLMSAAPVYAMFGIGRFDFLVCRGDLQPAEPTSQDAAEQIPELEADSANQGTRLRAMMYEHKGMGSFLGGVLRSTRGRYRVLMPHHNLRPDTSQPFFFQDDARAYFVTASPPQWIGTKTGGKLYPRRYRFDAFFHPYVCDFIAGVNRKGVKELLTLKSQALDDNGSRFAADYQPEPVQVQTSGAREHVDFGGSGSYSIYNWELFFHAPLFIATRLNANQRFSEARRWFHYIFDPTTRPGAFRPGTQPEPTQRFWNVRPFWEAQGREIHSIDDMLRGMESLSEQYAEWRQQPFKPFVVARLRQTAFMQSVVMRYLDNLIDWGDQEFSRFTMESTNEATLLYTLAAEILGRRPEKLPPRAHPSLQTYLSLQHQAFAASAGASPDAWRNFSDLMVEIEAYIPPAAVPDGVGTDSALGRMWAFCVPNNGNLLEYWKRVADRLFKLRHCQDIEGVERMIPLWDPEIDPALLVRAAAAGVDLASVLTDINAALPNYRFNVLLQKAIELSNEVRNFGAALLSALEKKEGEELAQLRSRHEVELLEKIKTVKLNQVEESRELRLAADKAKLVAEARRDHYRDIPFLISAEQTGLTLSALALTQEAGAVVSDVFAAIAAVVPQFHGGTSGFYSSPVVVSEYGGEQISRAAGATASVQRSAAALLSSMSALSHTVGGFQRRQQEWELQETLAQKEVDQIEKQIAAATIRESIADADLASHNLQKGNADKIDEHLRGKYTNQELFNWHQGQLSGLYFQAYKLAYDVAKKAERAFRYELGLEESSFVQFGYWDSLKKGLLAGERLQNDLRRMEAAYLDKNRREFEITRHVSLSELNPAALIALKEVGECEVDIPEWLFDLDYPGHYMRRIKSIALSIPCVAGPYTNVNCTLTQSFSRVRKDTLVADYLNESHFHSNVGIAQAIVTSTAREDSGLFELNFRDERYLPFEGTGAISRWRIKLPVDTNRFDVSTVSDVIFHVRYTARDGGEALGEAAWAEAKKEVSTGVRVFDARTDLATEWHRFKTPVEGQDSVLTLHLGHEHFPFHARGKLIRITSIGLIGTVDPAAPALSFSVKLGAAAPTPYSLGVSSGPGDLRSQEKEFKKALDDVVISGKAADAACVRDLLLLFRYELTERPVVKK